MFDKPIEQNIVRLPIQFFGGDFEESETTEDLSDDFDFTDNDFTEEETETETEQEQTQAEEVTENKEVPPNTEHLHKVKYNGKEMEMSLSDLITNAQKGMNYDKVLSERDSLRNAKEISFVKKVATSNNMTVDQYLQSVEDFEKKQALQNQIDKGIPKEIAERLLFLEEKEKDRATTEEQRQKQENDNKKYADFIERYPDVKQLPDEVLSEMAMGVDILAAYTSFENKQLKEQLKALTKNNENAKKSIGTLKGEASNNDFDDFLDGFNNA